MLSVDFTILTISAQRRLSGQAHRRSLFDAAPSGAVR